MKLPANARIAPEKLSRYLLARRSVGDKSEFLKRAGYTLDNAQRLERDIRRQILTEDAVVTKKTIYGQHYEIRAPLTGPNKTIFESKNSLDAGVKNRNHEVHNLVS